MVDVNKNTNEQLKFVDCRDGKVAVRTKICDGLSPSGLTTEGKITEVTLNSSTWVPLPATALTNRNEIGIQNLSGINIKLNFDDNVSGYVGITIANGSERHYSITDDIIIYAKAASGNPTVTVEELA
jgi:hypothetical protein